MTVEDANEFIEYLCDLIHAEYDGTGDRNHLKEMLVNFLVYGSNK